MTIRRSEPVRPRPTAASPAREPSLSSVITEVVRPVDLTDEVIAAIEASQMALGFEHLNVGMDET